MALTKVKGSVWDSADNGLLAADIKTAYESNADTNAFTDAEKTKLASSTAVVIDGIVVEKSNNLIPEGCFRNGRNGWGQQVTPASAYVYPTTDETTNFLARAMDYSRLQIGIHTAGGIARAVYAPLIPVDPFAEYNFRTWSNYAGGASANLTYEVYPVNYDGNIGIAISSTLSVSATIDAASEGGQYISLLPGDTTSVRLKLITGAAAGGNHNIYHTFFGKVSQLPMAKTDVKISGPGGGTHEGVYDGTSLFCICHGYHRLTKMNPETLEQQAITTVGSYPHDIVEVGNDVFIVTGGGTGSTKNIESYTKAAFTPVVSTAITGGRAGFAITKDDVSSDILWIGAGITAETPAIIKYTISTNSQVIINATDVDGGSANLPVEVLAGDLWSINGGDVKRISKAGTLVATVPVGRKIYGLGVDTDNSMLYVNYDAGVAVIDPTTNTVVKTYRFTVGAYGGTKLKYADGRMWGGTQSPASYFYIDIANQNMVEKFVFSGAPKWVEPTTTDKVIAGTFYTPELAILRAG